MMIFDISNNNYHNLIPLKIDLLISKTMISRCCINKKKMSHKSF